MKTKRRSHARAPGQTAITVSLPQELYDYICADAKKENRSRSNWIVTRLREMIAAREHRVSANSDRQ
jgi:metal-responsive CopG/Arc/MetJ family transcriptional regulator